MAWYITSAGNSLFHISIPNNDLIWTTDDHPGTVHLKPAQGTANQKWTFDWVGDR
ncbi:hypothetical protein P691DRAFT_808664 [Macrolepiota fuliginosa MF-IS2]|uniref:Uncharacterized protein n=1 Tax=Macrolepiota fuliginosa MF-IS2 TaxID=1400762 RepID=A0A9P6C6T3_9AGAR|nr:hypothetical protein P691DRAFT_808664 [Macrolepiota fuliginosa MF-IS2]